MTAKKRSDGKKPATKAKLRDIAPKADPEGGLARRVLTGGWGLSGGPEQITLQTDTGEIL